jgi:hypothetical protein
MRDLIWSFVMLCIGFSFGIGNSCVKAQTTYYSNNYGQMMGVANTVGYQTYYTNSYGMFMGTATTLPTTLPAAPTTTPSPSALPPLPQLQVMPVMQPMPMFGVAQ